MRNLTAGCCRYGSSAITNGLSIFLLTVLAFVAAPRLAIGQNACVDDFYVTDPNPGAASIFVSEHATTYSYSNCPMATARLGGPVKLRAGQSLYFWFRLQGNLAYLATDQSRHPFILKFLRDNGSVLVDRGSIDMGRLNRPAMSAEAASSEGPFDWRLGARKWQFDIPGNYKIVLTQHEKEVPCVGSFVGRCDLAVEVVP